MYKVAIRKNSTGELRINPNVAEFSRFWWTEGNGCCDCNRELFFLRAGSEEEALESDRLLESEEDRCGHSRYSVLYAELPDGTRIEIDNPEKNVL